MAEILYIVYNTWQLFWHDDASTFRIETEGSLDSWEELDIYVKEIALP
jgi:hypothetical protein